jgi:hypothetical protein
MQQQHQHSAGVLTQQLSRQAMVLQGLLVHRALLLVLRARRRLLSTQQRTLPAWYHC